MQRQLAGAPQARDAHHLRETRAAESATARTRSSFHELKARICSLTAAHLQTFDADAEAAIVALAIDCLHRRPARPPPTGL